MLELFGWNSGMGNLGAMILVFGAIVLAAIPLFIGESRAGYEFFVTAAAALVGGWLGSEAFGALSTWGPAFEELYLLPALIGAVILGGVVDVAIRYATGGSYTHEPRPI